jgi:hypothetical protein
MKKLLIHSSLFGILIGCSFIGYAQSVANKENRKGIRDSSYSRSVKNQPSKKRHRSKKYIADSIWSAREKMTGDSLDSIEDNNERMELKELHAVKKRGDIVGGINDPYIVLSDYLDTLRDAIQINSIPRFLYNCNIDYDCPGYYSFARKKKSSLRHNLLRYVSKSEIRKIMLLADSTQLMCIPPASLHKSIMDKYKIDISYSNLSTWQLLKMSIR